MQPHKSPALCFAGALAIGCALFFSFSWALVVVAVGFAIAYPRWLIVIPLAYGMCYLRMPNAPTIDAPTQVSGTFHAKRSVSAQLPFYSGYIVYGNLNKLPCSIFFSRNAKLPLDGAYPVSGTLKPGGILKPTKGHKWNKIPGSFSPAGMRHRIKGKLKKHIKARIGKKEAGDFLSAILCGELENRHMRFYFSKLGLSHILAISGLHFGLIALILSALTIRFLPYTFSLPALLVILTAYALLLGDSPSVMRAYFMISLYQIGKITGRYASPLNLCGAAATIELLLFPIHITYAGFILSYSATLAILLFYPKVNIYLQNVFPKPGHYTGLAAIESFLGNTLRSLLAVNIAVHLALIPIIIALFGHFAPLGLLYNLFVPLLVSCSLSLLIISLLLGPLGYPLHTLNTHFTTYLLELIRYPPHLLNIQIRASWLSPSLALILIGTLFIGAHRQRLFAKPFDYY